MLIEYSVENFRSIRERVTLSLVAANLRSRNPDLDATNEIPVSPKLSLLRSIVMYGANSSGKSNILKSINFMRRFIINSARSGQIGDAIDVDPFRLSVGLNEKPSTFEVVFLLDGLQHRYGFSVTSERVIEEWLYFQPAIREVELFTRDEEGIHPKPRFHAARGLVEQTRENALFLSVAAQLNNRVANQVLSWFKTTCKILNASYDSRFMPYTVHCLDKGHHRLEIEELVSRLDVDIAGLAITKISVPTERSASSTREKEGQQISLETADTDESTLQENLKNQLRSRHFIRDEQGKVIGTEDFPIEVMESEGTRKLIAIAGPLVDVLTSGAVLFVDEIDARLHPLLTSALINLFNSPATNPKNAQLVCATHDTNLLDRRFLRRDQIYFVEKDRTAATRLYSLAEFKLEPENGSKRTVRNDASYERDYIQGRYGAIPYVGDLATLFEEDTGGYQSKVKAEERTSEAVV